MCCVLQIWEKEQCNSWFTFGGALSACHQLFIVEIQTLEVPLLRHNTREKLKPGKKPLATNGSYRIMVNAKT